MSLCCGGRGGSSLLKTGTRCRGRLDRVALGVKKIFRVRANNSIGIVVIVRAMLFFSFHSMTN